MPPCTFRFRNAPCPRQNDVVLTGTEVAAINSWSATHTVKWAHTGTPACRVDYALTRAALAPAQPWARHVVQSGPAWNGTVTEFPAIAVSALNELECGRRLDSAIGVAVYDLVIAGQTVPDPVGP